MKNAVRGQTADNYQSIINTRITPALGKTPLSSLTPLQIEKLLNTLRCEGLSDSYIKKVFNVIKASLHKAVRWGLIARNPAALVGVPRVSTKELRVWDAAEVERFLKASVSDRYHVVFLLALATGMRKGEILGLRWKDIDFDNKVLCIRQILSHDGKQLLNETKTKASRRVIDLPEEVVTALKKHKRQVLTEKLRTGETYTDYDLVACTSTGNMLNPSNISRSFLRCIKAADVPRIRFHDLRHTHGSLLIAAGINVKVVAERFGHSSTRMTLDTYTHLMPSMQREAADEISKIMFQNKSASAN